MRVPGAPLAAHLQVPEANGQKQNDPNPDHQVLLKRLPGRQGNARAATATAR
jgi:hypothetical protein